MTEKLGLFFDEEVQRLIDSFAYCFKVKMTVFSLNMEELIVGLQNPGGRYCQLIQQELRIRYRCCRQDKLMCTRCEQRQELLVYHCYAGLSEAVMPIKVEDTLIGYAMLGQFRTQKALPGEILHQWLEAGFDSKKLQAAFMDQPFFDAATLDNMLRLFSMLVVFIVTRKYVKVRRPGLAEQIVQWVENHLSDSDSMTLDKIALAMNRSKSSISHIVKQQLGLSFTELYILKRIQRFESIVAVDPNISIQEAAFQVGYEDPFYFSRIYKKVRLAAPSSYIKSVREKPIEPLKSAVVEGSFRLKSG
jgi:AraC-like DNA-binding protein/ligand-binding sensor protein